MAKPCAHSGIGLFAPRTSRAIAEASLLLWFFAFIRGQNWCGVQFAQPHLFLKRGGGYKAGALIEKEKGDQSPLCI